MPDEIITCPKCGYNVKVPEQWGCHCDLAPGQNPDECVFDKNKPDDCLFATKLRLEGTGKVDCQYWRKW